MTGESSSSGSAWVFDPAGAALCPLPAAVAMLCPFPSTNPPGPLPRHTGPMLSFLPFALLLPITASDPLPSSDPNDEWVALDESIASLSASIDASESGSAQLWGFSKFTFAASGDLPAGTDLEYQGVAIDAARLYLDGSHGAFAYRLSMDFFSGSSGVVDAWASMELTEGASMRAGQFRTPFLHTAQIEANRSLFLLPTRNALFYRVRDQSRRGLMIDIQHGPLQWSTAVQNGFDITVDNHLVSSRMEIDLLGQGLGDTEGAYGVPSTPHLTTGIAYSDDASGEEGLALAADVTLTALDFYCQVEAVRYEADYTDLDVASGHILPSERDAGRGDTTPVSLTVSHLVPTTHWEIAARYEDFDDVLERELLTVGFNRYYQGHDAKVQINFSTETSTGDDADTFGIGLTLSF